MDKLQQVAPSAKKKKRKKTPNLPEILANNHRAKSALEKISKGEILSENELISLFKSDAVAEQNIIDALKQVADSESGELLKELSSLYVEEPKIVHGYLDFWCPNLENEMLAYFKKFPEQLYSLHPRKFEELVAAIFRNNGFNVQLTPQTRDGGVDIIAVQHSAFTGESVNLIECKRYAPEQKVGIGVVQRLLGAVSQHQATKGIVVTTSFFSKDARHVAESCKHQLVLKDYNNLQDWLQDIRVPRGS